MRILIVDDEGSLLVTLVANLELEGFEVIGVQDALSALQLVREQRFDLVLTDIRMPGMSGVELFRAIRSLHPDMPVLLMTAFAAEALIEEAIQEGVFAVLPKPFDIEHVIFALLRALRHPVVLFVDDADDTAPIAEALCRVGLAACVTPNQEATVLAIQQRRADVVLVNLAMPSSGAALVEQILGVDPSIAVIAISSSSAPELFHRVAELGAFACLIKPLEAARIVQLVARARALPHRPLASLRPAITNGGLT
ncbi:MAG TPA: response regulator [Polyangiaceae bacterium]|nr:response regulator [Polyangiaceae bacterium]